MSTDYRSVDTPKGPDTPNPEGDPNNMSIALDHPQISNDGPWTLGVKIGLPIALAVGLVLLLIIAACVYSFIWGDNGGDEDLLAIGGGFTLLALLGLVGGCLYGYYPYDSSYHQYRAVTGTVDRITSRLLAGDGTGTDQKFVVTFKGSPQQYGVNDTRASLVRPGDTITVSCIRSFQYGSTDGYDCNWGKP